MAGLKLLWLLGGLLPILAEDAGAPAQKQAQPANATSVATSSAVATEQGFQVASEQVTRLRGTIGHEVNTTVEMAPESSKKFLPFYCSGCLGTDLLCYKYRCAARGSQICSNIWFPGCRGKP